MKLGKGGNMTDLDFDEIDKAVTSAMSSETVETPDSTDDSSLPMVVEENLPAEVEKPLPPAVRRTTGRIMDVVGPSKSVKRNTKVINPNPTPETSSSNQSDELVDAAPTPFLPDANEKVEKRPLGSPDSSTGAGVNASEFHAEPVNPRAQNDVPELGSVDQPVGSDAPVPAELSEDLLSLDGSVETFETPFVAGTSPETNEVNEKTPAPETQQETVELTQPEPSVPDVAPSIVQQYQEKQSSANETTGAIYDTEAYHTPIKESGKKKNILWIILWIVGLLVVGAGIGWVVYTFVLPLL